MDAQLTPSDQSVVRPSVLLPPGREIPQIQVAAQAAEFHYPTTLRGSTANFNIYYNPNLASSGQAIADGVLATCERDYSIISGYFGGITPPELSFNVIIASEVLGAYHADCKSTDIYCQAVTTPGLNIDFARFSLFAEVVEVFSAVQARGWNCLASNGEGLSRVLATAHYPAELGYFYSAATWLNEGRPDFINVTDPSDNDYLSIGCAVLFLNYLRYQLNFAWNEIVQGGGPTLAQTYSNLTGSKPAESNGCLQQFKAFLQAHYPEGTRVTIMTDNPFPLPNPDLAGAVKGP
jgi:hypothetical protein